MSLFTLKFKDKTKILSIIPQKKYYKETNFVNQWAMMYLIIYKRYLTNLCL